MSNWHHYACAGKLVRIVLYITHKKCYEPCLKPALIDGESDAINMQCTTKIDFTKITYSHTPQIDVPNVMPACDGSNIHANKEIGCLFYVSDGLIWLSTGLQPEKDCFISRHICLIYSSKLAGVKCRGIKILQSNFSIFHFHKSELI